MTLHDVAYILLTTWVFCVVIIVCLTVHAHRYAGQQRADGYADGWHDRARYYPQITAVVTDLGEPVTRELEWTQPVDWTQAEFEAATTGTCRKRKD